MLMEHLLAAGLPTIGHDHLHATPPSKQSAENLWHTTRAISPYNSTGSPIRWILHILSVFKSRAPFDFSSSSSLGVSLLNVLTTTGKLCHSTLIYNSSESACGRFLLLSIYTLEGDRHIALVGCIRVPKSSCFDSESRTRRIAAVTTDASPSRLRLHLRSLRFALLSSTWSSVFVCRIGLGGYPLLIGYHDFSKLRTTFGFLRCFGPKRLRPSRKVLLDQDEYQIMHIGRGAFATISRVLHKPTGDTRVIKRISFDNSGLARSLAEAEVDALKAVKGSSWFPLLLNHFRDDDEFVITMPFYGRGDLAGLIEHKGYLGRELAQFYCAELIIAIQSLHKQGIIHRDIKPDNIFLDDDGHLILADLGLAENIATFEGGEEAVIDRFSAWVEARTKGGDDFPLLWVDGINPLGTREIAGTYWYTAPEVFRKELYSFGVDFWSVGVIYHALVTGHIPFDNYNPYPESKRPELDFSRGPGQLRDIQPWEEKALAEMLAPHHVGRPQTVTKIKQSPLFDGVDWAKIAQRQVLPPLLPQPLLDSV